MKPGRFLFVLSLSSIFAVALAASAIAQSNFTPAEEKPEDFAAGEGRDETFYACTACHNFKLVAQQGMNRRQWDDTLSWMTEKHSMPAMEGNDRKVVLDYLEKAFPQRAPAGSGGHTAPNPFLNR